MKKLLIFLLCFVLVISSSLAFARFDDIDKSTSDWAGEAIDALDKLNVINGYPDGTFKPNDDVTRAEFAKMLFVAFEPKGGDVNFEDISDSWAAEYIANTGSSMYVYGTKFCPEDAATRADIAYAVSAVLNLKPSDITLIDKFSDSADIIDEMKENIAAAVQNEIIIGYDDNTLKPNGAVTRAEAAVIIFRALNIKNTPEDETPEVPNPPSNEEKPEEDKEHITTLYPCRDVLLVTAVSSTIDESNGEEAYRISYRIANDEKEYSSLIPSDTQVRGVKTSVSQIGEGDVMIMDTAFLGDIGYLYIFASFDSAVPAFDTQVTAFRDYSVVHGKVTAINTSGKAVQLTLDNGTGTTVETILKSVDTNVFAPWKRADRWSLDSLGAIDPLLEDTYVFIRYTDGIATEVVVSDIQSN